jgi:hypothetical protein
MNQDILKYEIVHDEYRYLQKAIKEKKNEDLRYEIKMDSNNKNLHVLFV